MPFISFRIWKSHMDLLAVNRWIHIHQEILCGLEISVIYWIRELG